MKATTQHKKFTLNLMDWHRNANDRSLPWKEEKDPYKIWLSEIILQQTRAQQGLPYYLKFIDVYPTVADMAGAKDEDAFRIWQGLGYYNRCRNMLATARTITNDLGGKFPKTYEGLLQLKGIGPYTAAAIASFAFGAANAVVDGNVYRVLARYFGIETPFDTTEGKKQFSKLANELLDTTDSAAYNQAIMDLGATVCTPANPVCNNCPLQKNCIAHKQDMTTLLPVKSKKQKITQRYFHFLLLHAGDNIWIHKRTGKDIWQNLHEPLLIEDNKVLDVKALQKNDIYKTYGFGDTVPEYGGYLIQKLTHQHIESHFFSLQLKKEVKLPIADGGWIAVKGLKNIAFPKTLVSFLEKKLYF